MTLLTTHGKQKAVNHVHRDTAGDGHIYTRTHIALTLLDLVHKGRSKGKRDQRSDRETSTATHKTDTLVQYCHKSEPIPPFLSNCKAVYTVSSSCAINSVSD